MTPTDLRTTLARLGLSQRRFAGECETDPRTVQRWVKGDHAVPHWVPSWLRMWEAMHPPT